MILSLIVAADEKNVIGGGNRLLWQLPEDMRRFRELTKGHPVIMGRKTFESIGRALPGRRNIVVSRRKDFAAKGCDVFASLDAALHGAGRGSPDEVFVIGGGELYVQAVMRADRIYLTRVHAELIGDTYFPLVDEREWVEVAHEEHPADARHAYAFTFLVYERRRFVRLPSLAR